MDRKVETGSNSEVRNDETPHAVYNPITPTTRLRNGPRNRNGNAGNNGNTNNGNSNNGNNPNGNNNNGNNNV